VTSGAALGSLVTHPLVVFVVVAVTMVGEGTRSAQHERRLRALGAVEPASDVYAWMQVTYPLGFAACLLEGWWRGPEWTTVGAAGLLVFTAGKAIKYVAIATLGYRWTFRVLPLPGAPLVERGIYRWLRHPNYVGVGGEILGIALWMRAPVAGTLFGLVFGWLLHARIRVEERAVASAAAR
jgi:methyltransferase